MTTIYYIKFYLLLKIINTIIFKYRIRKALENRTNMEDDRVGILESQLSQAKLIAEEADKKYEEVQPPIAFITIY